MPLFSINLRILFVNSSLLLEIVIKPTLHTHSLFLSLSTSSFTSFLNSHQISAKTVTVKQSIKFPPVQASESSLGYVLILFL